MRVERSDGRLIVRIEDDEPAVESLTRLCEREGVTFASVSGAGAVRWVRLAFWNPDSKEYEPHEIDEQLEVVSFQGNVALKDERPFLHLHGVFGRRDLSVLGGHIVEARVHPTLEAWVRSEPVPVRRGRDPATGLDLLDLPR